METELGSLVADSLKDGIGLGFKILYDSIKLIVLEHPVGTIAVIAMMIGLIILNGKYSKKKKK